MAVIPLITPPPNSTEQLTARFFADNYKNVLRYNHQSNQWLIWEGHHWRPDGKKVAFRYALDTCNNITNSPQAQKVKFAASVEIAARALMPLATETTEWDRDPLLLGTPDGVVDLSSGELRGGRPDELISKITSVSPADSEDCPLFDDFISFALGDDSTLIQFLFRYLGYGLTGLTREEFVLFLIGRGGSGKGTLTKTVENIMGGYATSVPMTMFTEKSPRQEYYRAALQGHRLVVAAEPEQGSAWNEAFFNEVTGGDRIPARHPGGKPFEFDPTFKLVIHGNSVPDLRGAPTGIVRRLGLLPFERVPVHPDLTLKEKLRVEYPAIFRRVINACRDYLQSGLKVPDTVRAGTKEYFEEQDTLNRFIADACDKNPQARLRSGYVLGAYNTWADQNGERRINSSGLFALIKNSTDRTIKNVKGHANTRWVQGFSLKNE